MKKHTLSGASREPARNNVKKLRRDGNVPATVYGKNIKSESLSLKLDDFARVYGEAHETGLVELSINGVVRPVLIHSVQKHPVKGVILHVEFHQVDLKEKVRANIPIVLVGEAPAAAQKLGVVLSVLSEVEVEALPTDLPEKVEMDISTLIAVDQELKVSDIRVSSGVTLLSDTGLVVAKVGSLVSREAEQQAAEEAAKAAETAAPEGEATPTEEKAKPEETATEKKPEAQ